MDALLLYLKLKEEELESMSTLVIAEKSSVGLSLARVIGATKRHEGYLEGNGNIVTWCVGHLVTMSYPEEEDMKYERWSFDTLPFLRDEFK